MTTTLPIHYAITLATPRDLPAVMALIAAGIQQWDAEYPDQATLTEDIRRESLFVMKHDGQVIAIMTLNDQQDDAYAGINWQYAAERVLVVHRLAVHPAQQGRGVAGRIMAFAERYGCTGGYGAIRLDAFLENPRAVALYEQQGYSKAGLLQFRKGTFWAFEKRISG